MTLNLSGQISDKYKDRPGETGRSFCPGSDLMTTDRRYPP